MAGYEWNTRAGGSFEAWNYDPEGDAVKDKTPIAELQELPDTFHGMRHKYERPANMKYYILRNDFKTSGRNLIIEETQVGIGLNSISNTWEYLELGKGSTVNVIGVLKIVDPDNALYGFPTETFEYLYAMPGYKYVVIQSDDLSLYKRTIIRPGGGSSAAAAGGGSSAAAAGGDSSAAAAGGDSSAVTPPSAKRFRKNNFNAKPEISIPNMPGGMRKPRYSKNKKSRKSRKSRKSQRKTSKSRN
jgi:hypothetical protein